MPEQKINIEQIEKTIFKTSNYKLGISLEYFKEIALQRKMEDCFSWGVKELDESGGLLLPGTFNIIGGTHGVGKTTFITQLVEVNAKDKPILFCPLEMGIPYVLMSRAINLYNTKAEAEALPILTYGDAEDGRINEPELLKAKPLFNKCVEEVYETEDHMRLDMPDDYSFERLEELILAYIAEGVEMFVIDHVHCLHVTEEGDNVFFTRVAKRLREMAVEFSVCILAVVQLTKEGNDPNKQISNASFKGTSEWTSNAYRSVIITKPIPPALIKSDMAPFIAAYNLANGTSLDHKHVAHEKAIEYLEDRFRESSMGIREVTFTKSRGRNEGTHTVNATKGSFNYNHYGKHVFDKLKPDNLISGPIGNISLHR